MPRTRINAGALLGLAIVWAMPSTAPAHDYSPAPTYSRMRAGADDWHARGGGYGPGYPGYGAGYGYFQPYVSPVIAGSWYARPYPHHFDYFRDRWNGSASELQQECPCAEELPAAAPPGADEALQ